MADGIHQIGKGVNAFIVDCDEGGPQWDGSIRHLATYEFAIACFGHSAPPQAKPSGAFERFAKTLEAGSSR